MRRQISLLLSIAPVMLFMMQSAPPAAAVESAAKAPSAAKGLIRVDFHLEKASCPTCVLKVRKALRELKGMKACEIALRKPYGGVVVYDTSLVNMEKVKFAAQQADPNKRVEIVEPVEESVRAVPKLLIPRYSTLKKS